MDPTSFENFTYDDLLVLRDALSTSYSRAAEEESRRIRLLDQCKREIDSRKVRLDETWAGGATSPLAEIAVSLKQIADFCRRIEHRGAVLTQSRRS